MHLEEKTLKRNEIYDGKVLHVFVDEVELENGRTSKREIIEHPGGVCVAAVTEAKELLFVKQYRYPYRKAILELPAGKLNKGENPDEAIIRELKEETGCTGREFRSLGDCYPSPGYTDEIIRLYMTEVESYGEQNPDEDEFLDVIRIPYRKAVEMVMNNELSDAKSQILILKVARILEEQE